MGLFEIKVEKIDNVNIIKITIMKGRERPYYLKERGMIPDGCYFRAGSSIANMEDRMIVFEYTKR